MQSMNRKQVQCLRRAVRATQLIEMLYEKAEELEALVEQMAQEMAAEENFADVQKTLIQKYLFKKQIHSLAPTWARARLYEILDRHDLMLEEDKKLEVVIPHV